TRPPRPCALGSALAAHLAYEDPDEPQSAGEDGEKGVPQEVQAAVPGAGHERRSAAADLHHLVAGDDLLALARVGVGLAEGDLVRVELLPALPGRVLEALAVEVPVEGRGIGVLGGRQ